MNTEIKVAIIILAAGSSSRMGESKQLLLIQKEPLLRRITRIAAATNPFSLIVVLGAQGEVHEKVLYDLPVTVIHNPQWQQGMGSSLKAGIRALHAEVNICDAAIILVCDQPHVSSDYIQSLIDRHKISRRSIVASSYSGTVGVPVLFGKNIFSQILQIPDSSGAKVLIEQFQKEVEYVNFPEGSIDLDTKEDYQSLLLQKNLPH